MQVAANRAWSSAEDCEGRSVRKGRGQKLRSGEVERQSLLAALRCARGCASATSAMPGAAERTLVLGSGTVPRLPVGTLNTFQRKRPLAVRGRTRDPGRCRGNVGAPSNVTVPRLPRPTPNTFQRKRPLAVRGRNPGACDVAAERRRAKHRHRPSTALSDAEHVSAETSARRPWPAPGSGTLPRKRRRAKQRHRPSTAPSDTEHVSAETSARRPWPEPRGL